MASARAIARSNFSGSCGASNLTFSACACSSAPVRVEGSAVCALASCDGRRSATMVNSATKLAEMRFGPTADFRIAYNSLVSLRSRKQRVDPGTGLLVCVANARRELVDVLEHALQHPIRVHPGGPAGKSALVQQFHLHQHRRCGMRQLRRGM